MSEFNPNNRERYIMLYADDFTEDVWREYCEALGVSETETEIRVNFDYSDVYTFKEEM